MRYSILALAILALMAFGCDRFSHDFLPPVGVDFEAAFFSPLQTGFDNATPTNLTPVMQFYADDYLHFGINKGEREDFYQNILSLNPNASIEVTMQSAQTQTDSTAIVNWRLKISSAADKSVLIDSTFVGERLVKRNGNWLLRGNQIDCDCPTVKQRVILEYFSFLGCPNCPVVDALLHDLQAQYPNQLSYLEYHISGPATVPGDNTFAYYGYSSVPAVVFQGQSKLVGSNPDVLDLYQPLIASLIEIDSPMSYQDIGYSIIGQTINGSVRVIPLSNDFGFAQTYLTYVLIDRVSTYNNVLGIPLKNLVLAKGSIDISTYNIELPIDFTLVSSKPIPDDASLVIYVQRKPSPFANDAVIYSGVEFPLQVKK
ncbi:MAG: hypothetical protein Q8M98_01010 [Candidatus Cloacimonadaceae bacterium]|nr:hypothetical protein [Candidatus Cloacimonadaceae bacterium]MDP3113329.1 hypothetical protein [Candidatus Cloacimonadaceae bacterium]